MEKFSGDTNLVDMDVAEAQFITSCKISPQPERKRHLTERGLPDVFATDGLSYENRYSAYYDQILSYRRPCEVSKGFKKFIEEEIEPVGWQAVWRSEQLDCDILIQVNDVRATDFKADVKLVEPLQCNPSDTSLENITELLTKTGHLVPLAELYPVYDDSGDYDKTALVIEHLRFFYDHIWRGWDEEDEDDYIYVERHLTPRLKLYYDIAGGNLATETVKKYTSALNEYKDQYEELQILRKQVGGSDSENDLDEVALVQLTQKYQQLKILQQSLQVMENPMMRLVISHQDSFNGSMLGQPKGPRPDGSVVTHIVTDKLTVSMIQNLQLSSDTVIKEYESPSSALCSCYDGDTILILPGTYTADGFYDLQDSITIRGVGDRDEIVINCGQGGDISVDCNATHLTLVNLTFTQDGTTEGVLCVRHGMTTLDNCKFVCDAKGVVVRQGAELMMKGCEVYGAKSAGVTIHEGSVARISNNDIHHCGQTQDGRAEGGILIKANMIDDEENPRVKLSANKIHDNFGYGITITQQLIGMENDPEITKGINLENMDNSISYNSLGCLGSI
ncbi:SHC SH2 domain-binding protein 1 homolog B-like [Glandiceps talaboti]